MAFFRNVAENDHGADHLLLPITDRRHGFVDWPLHATSRSQNQMSLWRSGGFPRNTLATGFCFGSAVCSWRICSTVSTGWPIASELIQPVSPAAVSFK